MKRVLLFGLGSFGVAVVCFALAAVSFSHLPDSVKNSISTPSAMGFAQTFLDGKPTEGHPVHVDVQVDPKNLETLDVETMSIDIVVRSGSAPKADIVLSGSSSCENGIVVDLLNQREGSVALIRPVFRQGVGGPIVTHPSCEGMNRMELALTLPADFRGGVRLKTISGDLSSGDGLTLGSIQAETISGDLTFERISAQDVQVFTKSGTTDMEHIDAKRAAVHSISGNISVTGDGSHNEVQLSSVSGKIDGVAHGRITATTTSGDIDVTLYDPQDSFEFHSVSGDVGIHFEGVSSMHAEASTVSGDIETEGGWMNVQRNSGPGRTTVRASLGAQKGSVVVSTTSGTVRLSTK